MAASDGREREQRGGDQVTPAMRQYLEAKARVPDAILLFRMGDFYELFYEDAQTAAPIMEVVLTSRSSKTSDNRVPMCGVPYHALNAYVKKLLEAGCKVAICEQMEDPALAKGVVRREIVRVVSPGVNLDIESLESDCNNFLAAVVQGLDGLGLAVLDASTGEFRACRADDYTQLHVELSRLVPRELVYPEALQNKADKLTAILPRAFVHAAGDRLFEPAAARELLVTERLVEAPPVSPSVLQAAGGLVAYLRTLQREDRLQLSPLELYEIGNYLVLDETAIADLELLRTIAGGEKRGSLLGLMDQTTTAMGARLLRRHLAYPLMDRDSIERRLDAVGELLEESILRSRLTETLKQFHDIERLAARVVTRLATPIQLRALALSMSHLEALREGLADCRTIELTRLAEAFRPSPPPLSEALQFIQESPPVTIREGGIFKAEYDQQLSELLELTRGGKEWLLSYEVQQRELTGISSLKVRYNKVFGYYMEVTRPNLHLVPGHFIRKQTLANAERFYTPELKEHEEKVLQAQELANRREEEFFVALLERVAAHQAEILAAAEGVATLDFHLALARLAHAGGYCRPVLDYGDLIELKESRHPVVEKMLPAGRFVANDICLDSERQQLLIITGPNMAGKSTVMRQAALIVLMAQMGSFVPARSAHIGIVDRIFTRVGASDSLSRGLSTFMVEMKEAAEIMKRATRRSLLILDELGRGTSTYDGLAIAWSMAEYIHDFLRSRALFATHYHELTQLTDYKKRVRNFNIAVKEFNDEILFLHRLVEGAANRSYGVQVARLAGVPIPVIDRAKEILASLEEGSGDIAIERPRPVRKRKNAGTEGLSLFAAAPERPAVSDLANRLERHLANLSLDTTTPLEALNLLNQWKRELQASQPPGK